MSSNCSLKYIIKGNLFLYSRGVVIHTRLQTNFSLSEVKVVFLCMPWKVLFQSYPSVPILNPHSHTLVQIIPKPASPRLLCLFSWCGRIHAAITLLQAINFRAQVASMISCLVCSIMLAPSSLQSFETDCCFSTSRCCSCGMKDHGFFIHALCDYHFSYLITFPHPHAVTCSTLWLCQGPTSHRLLYLALAWLSYMCGHSSRESSDYP